MGYDYSCHPVDVSLIRDRIVPYILGQGEIGDLLEKAAGNIITRYRANSWGLAVSDLEHRLQDRLGHEEAVTIPGFASDLHIWGRPFFNVAGETDKTLKMLDEYLSLAGQPVEAVDDLALSMIRLLNEKNGDIKSENGDRAADLLSACYPLEEHILRDDDGFEYNRKEIVATLQVPLNTLRHVYSNLDQRSVVINIDGEEEKVDPQEVMGQAFFESLNFYSQIIPGWMGRGYYWPTRLFEEIEVNVFDIFESPKMLFQPLIEQVPYLEAYLENTIVENYSLGGFVPPEKMGQFIKRLEKHKTDLIFAWEEKAEKTKHANKIPLNLMAPFLKIYEAAVYAEDNGYGFLEASEIYSGFEGTMN